MSFTPTYTRTNVLAGMAAVYLAPYSATSPAVLPAEMTVDLGGTWPSTPQPWTAIGATQEGVTFGFQRTTQDLTIEEQLTPVQVLTTGVQCMVEAVLAESTFENMRIAYGGGTVTTTAAAVGNIGKKTLVISSDLDHFALGLEGINPEGFFRRILIPDVVSIADVQEVYRRAQSLRMYKVSFRSLVAPESMTFVNKTANHL